MKTEKWQKVKRNINEAKTVCLYPESPRTETQATKTNNELTARRATHTQQTKKGRNAATNKTNNKKWLLNECFPNYYYLWFSQVYLIML